MVRRVKEVRKIKKMTDGTEDSFVSLEEGSEFTVEDKKERESSLKIDEELKKAEFQKWKKTDIKDHLLEYFSNDIIKSEDFWSKQKAHDKKIREKFSRIDKLYSVSKARSEKESLYLGAK